MRSCRRAARASDTETARDRTAMTVAQIATTMLAFISWSPHERRRGWAKAEEQVARRVYARKGNTRSSADPDVGRLTAMCVATLRSPNSAWQQATAAATRLPAISAA